MKRCLALAYYGEETIPTIPEIIYFSGLEKQMAALSVSAKEEDIKELIDIFDCHFDPSKEPKGPKPRTPRQRIRVCVFYIILSLT